MADPVARSTLNELSEVDAAGDIAEIYAELRRLTGVPVVALIFRHLATHERLLAQIWTGLQSVLRSGALQDAAAPIVEANISPDLIPPIDANVRRAIAFEGEEVRATLNAIDSYNRANATNLLIMLSLLKRLELPDDVAQAVPMRTWVPPAPISGPLSPMTSPSEMPDHIRRMINDLGFGDRKKLDAVVPSLFRHFCDAPGLLAIMHVVLAPKFKDGTMANAVARLQESVVAEAARLAPYVAPLPQLAATPAACSVMREFTATWIPQMTVIGFTLRRSLSDL